MKKSFSVIPIICLTASFHFTACQPTDDPVSPDISDQIQRRYCNDPFAINYNDSFPGIPDNDRCYYPQDLISGTWNTIDSIFRQDGEFIEVIEKVFTIVSIPTEDKNRVSISNWCTIDGNVEITVNKYGKFDINNQLEYPNEGQIVCTNDTLTGTGLYKVNGDDTTFSFDVLENKSTGQIRQHKILGFKP